jgi:Asp-tRNA(Asn)/Glu-tRNA(Gln) amidotransferase A subunit family amidase
MTYDLQTVRVPRLSGFMLRTAAMLLDSALTRWLLAPTLLRDSGVAAFRRVVLEEAPSVAPKLPHPGTPSAAAVPTDWAGLIDATPLAGFRFDTVSDFVRAYAEKRTTPDEVGERVIAAIKQSEAAAIPLRAITHFNEEEIRRQARDSAQRHRTGKTLGPLDGVPIAIKDELDVLPYPTTVGTAFLKEVPKLDSTVTARLRAAGALIIGKANMHEIGIDTSGFNAHHGTARNPYDPGRYTGGSSSGCGSAVGAGLCPIAIGADGGGSIRIPASLCGVVGLKATWGRVSEAGAAPLCWSVAHVGPLGATVRDVAIAYAAIAGPDPRDANSQGQPAPRGVAFTERLDGVRLGVFTPWLEHATPAVVSTCRGMLEKLRGLGATIVEVEIPHLELARLAHAITILSEMATGMDQYDAEHRSDYGFGVRLNLALARELTNRDYIRAQQVRTRMTAHFDRVFEQVDAIVTPTTAITAPRIRPDVLPSGESDLDMTSAMMRYVFPANLTGHPALSVPTGFDPEGMPIGLQLMGRAWEEDLLLRIGAVVERQVERKAPAVHFRLVG